MEDKNQIKIPLNGRFIVNLFFISALLFVCLVLLSTGAIALFDSFWEQRDSKIALDPYRKWLKSNAGVSEFALAQQHERQIIKAENEEMLFHLSELRKKAEFLEQQLTSLQQVISPKNASDILTMARVKQEILAREDFEKRIDGSLKDTCDKVDKIQNWLLGLFTSIIVSLFGFAIILLRRTSLLYNTVQSLQSQINLHPVPPNQ